MEEWFRLFIDKKSVNNRIKGKTLLLKMIILGISDNHEAHACILKDGVLLACIAEERLTRVKSDTGYPFKAINKVFRNN